MKKHTVKNRKRIQDFEAACRRRGMPLTVQRRTVLETLLERQDHPTADQIFTDVARRLPGVSRTTVYRVLETLVEAGVASKASHLGAASRFDPVTERHHHLVCVGCDKLLDLRAPSLDRLALPRRRGFQVLDYTIQFKGFCAVCRRRAGGSIRTTRRK
jgi:Fur family peroxide stress response transcriptional regulator